MSKKKPTHLEKRLKEIYLKRIEVLKFNPDFWDQNFPGSDYHKWGRQELREKLAKYPTFEALLDAHKYWPDDLYSLCFQLVAGLAMEDEHLWAAMVDPNQILERDFWRLPDPESGLRLLVNLQFKDGLIKNWVDVILDHFYHPLYKYKSNWKDIYLDSDWVLEVKNVLDTEGKNPFLLIRVNLSAGKMKIRQAVGELLNEYRRDTVPTPKFSPKTMELALEIYELRHEECHSFAQIALMVGKSKDWVEELYKQIYEFINQEKYGTKRSRGEASVSIADRSPISLEDAENVYARMQMVGAGGRHISRQEWDDEGSIFFTSSPETPERPTSATFDNWGRKFGNTNTCMELRGKRARGWVKHKEDCDKCPHFFFDSYISELPKKTARDHEIVRCSGPESRRGENGYIQCKFYRGHPRCLDCNQTYPPSIYTTGQMATDVTYVRRSPFPPTHPCTSKVVIRVKKSKFKTPYPPRHEQDPPGYVKIDEYIRFHRTWGMIREQELKLQDKYIAKHGIAATCPMKVAEGFGPGWGWDIAYGPMSDEPVKKEIIIIASSASQYSLAFTLPKDQLEWLIVNLIDQRAEESRH